MFCWWIVSGLFKLSNCNKVDWVNEWMNEFIIFGEDVNFDVVRWIVCCEMNCEGCNWLVFIFIDLNVFVNWIVDNGVLMGFGCGWGWKWDGDWGKMVGKWRGWWMRREWVVGMVWIEMVLVFIVEFFFCNF